MNVKHLLEWGQLLCAHPYLHPVLYAWSPPLLRLTPMVIFHAVFISQLVSFTIRLLWAPQEQACFCSVPHSTQHGAGHTAIAQQTLIYLPCLRHVRGIPSLRA